jgi:hypothetical protein
MLQDKDLGIKYPQLPVAQDCLPPAHQQTEAKECAGIPSAKDCFDIA